jgi:hypothetical protein
MEHMAPVYKKFLDNLPHVVDIMTKSAINPVRVSEVCYLSISIHFHCFLTFHFAYQQAIEDALRSGYPKTRYLVGWEAWIVPTLFWLIPDRMRDFIIMKLYSAISKK